MRRLFLAACLGFGARAAAQPAWPARPVTILVPYVAGGPSDTLGRVVAGAMRLVIGQPVVVESRLGGNGAVAAGLLARAPPDGHTLLVAASGLLTIIPHVVRNLGYDPLRDFAPLTLAISAPNILVANPDFSPRSVPGLVAWLKANPHKASYGSSGIGSSEHLNMVLFAQRTGTSLMHVPYGGSAAAVIDLIAGNTEVAFLNFATVAGHLRSGALRPIATGGLSRHPLLPAVPTVDESGLPGFEAGSWHGLVAPAATPEPVLQALHAALVAALRDPDCEAQLIRTGFGVVASGRADFAVRLRREYEAWGQVVKTAGITAQ